MAIVTGYISFTGYSGAGNISGWILANDSYFSGLYQDVTGIDIRIVELDVEMNEKVDESPTFNSFANVEAQLRAGLQTRIAQLEADMRLIKQAIVALRRNT